MVSQRAWTIASLLMRLATVAVLLMSIRLIMSDNIRYTLGVETKYSDLASYRYVLASGILGVVGTLLQIPVTLYILCKSKRMMVSVLLLEISMYVDKVISLALASGAGAGFGVSIDIKYWYLDQTIINVPDLKSKLEGFLNKGAFATIFLLAGLVLSACTSVVSTKLRISANA